MIVRARHVSMLRHVPRGGRHARLGAVSTPMDAELRELSSSDFSAPLPHNPTLRVRGDHVWEEFGCQGSEGEARPVPVRPFLDVLAGNPSPFSEITDAFRKAFAHTPLVASTWGISHPYKIVENLTQGDQGEPRSKEILRDGRGRSAAKAADFLREEIAVVDDRILVRRHPLANWHIDGIKVTLDVELTPYGRRKYPYHFDIGRRAEVLSGYLGMGKLLVPEAAAAVLEALPADPDPGTEAVYYATVLPGAAIAAVDSAKAKGITNFSEELLDLYERLHPYAEAGAVGALTLDEVDPALDLCEDIAWRLLTVNVSPSRFDWHKVDGFFRRGRIGRLPRSLEDEGSLGILAP